MKELFEIYDGSAEAKKAKGKSKNLSGFHPLFTAAARRSIALDALKICWGSLWAWQQVLQPVPERCRSFWGFLSPQ